MAKANKKSKKPKITEAELNESFDAWEQALDNLKEKAEQSFMPLLAQMFEFGKGILDMYRKAYINVYNKQKEK